MSLCKSQFNIPYREIWLSPIYEEFTITYLTNYILLLPSLVDAFLICIFNSVFLYNYKCKSNKGNDDDMTTTTTTLTTDFNPTDQNCNYEIHALPITIFFIIYMIVYVAIGAIRFFKKP